MINRGLLGNSNSLSGQRGCLQSGDTILYNPGEEQTTKEVRVAKKNYPEKLKKELSANDPASVWTGLRNIKYKTPPPQSVENHNC